MVRHIVENAVEVGGISGLFMLASAAVWALFRGN
jgi:hypothetical protein